MFYYLLLMVKVIHAYVKKEFILYQSCGILFNIQELI